jgi:hypothetical protein
MVSILQLLNGDQSGGNAHQGWKSSVLRRTTILSSSKSVNRYSLINLRKCWKSIRWEAGLSVEWASVGHLL